MSNITSYHEIIINQKQGPAKYYRDISSYFNQNYYILFKIATSLILKVIYCYQLVSRLNLAIAGGGGGLQVSELQTKNAYPIYHCGKKWGNATTLTLFHPGYSAPV